MRQDEVLRRAAVAGRRTGGVVRLGELGLARADHDVVQRLVERGRWLRLARGLLLTRPGPPDTVALAHGGALLVEGGVLTGLLAAQLSGLRWVPATTRAHVLVAGTVQRTSTPYALVRRNALIEHVPTWEWDGVRVAGAAQVVVDAARECRWLGDVRGLVLGAVADGRATPAQITGLLDAGAIGGTALCRRAVRDAVAGAASPPEAEAADVLRGRGWSFLLNAELWLDGVLLGVVDVYLVGTGVGGEVDSVEHHSGASLTTTLTRHGSFDRAGVVLEHVTPYELHRGPERFAERLIARAVDRLRRGLGEPEGLVVRPRGPLQC